MKIVIQRVSNASVVVENKVVGAISPGLMLLVGFGKVDTKEKLPAMAEKVANLRIFPDEKGRFHYSLLEIKGEILLVPQFTLYADCSKGRRPEFFNALEPQAATELFDLFVEEFKKLAIPKVQTGVFGAEMHVSLLNHGPVTILLES